MAKVIPKNLMGMLHFFFVLWHSIEVPSTQREATHTQQFLFLYQKEFFFGYSMVSLLNKLVIVLHGAMTHADQILADQNLETKLRKNQNVL
jgi:hypothetical protein